MKFEKMLSVYSRPENARKPNPTESHFNFEHFDG